MPFLIAPLINSNGAFVLAPLVFSDGGVIDPTDQTVPVITTGGNTTLLVPYGGVYNDPSWTWFDGAVFNQAVTWSGPPVNTVFPGTYTRTATAVNSLGVTTQTFTVVVSNTGIDFISQYLETDIQVCNLYVERENQCQVIIGYNGTPLDLTQFTHLELIGLTNTPIDSDTDLYILDWNKGNGVLLIDTGRIAAEDLLALHGTLKTTLIGYNDTDTLGVVLWHSTLDKARVSFNIVIV